MLLYITDDSVLYGMCNDTKIMVVRIVMSDNVPDDV